MELSGRVALVTGGSMGIGNAIVLCLAKAGADVAFTYRKHEEAAAELSAEAKKLGRKAIALKTDVSSTAAAESAVKETVLALGKIDILVNNAGITWDGVIWKMTEEQWDSVLDTNLKGYFNYIRAAAPLFREQGSGKIVNITSINAMRGKFGQSNYSASKAGIIGLTKTVARELGKSGVTVNAIAPGMIETDMMKGLPEEVKNKAKDETVLGRLGTPEDIGELVVFLSSDRAKHITGEVIKVDGGQYI